ncbi:MAG: MerR family transcriptional regulator [Bacillota bacterium]|nr:MerR family transcriptional regulator [Bacillota bacterium]
MGLSVGKAARLFGLSRTALLYYDSIGLVSPSERSEAGYRIYNEKDIEKLKSVRTYRNAGISLEEIADLINGNESRIAASLLKRLGQLNDEIIAAKAQQAIIVRILRTGKTLRNIKHMDQEKWNEVLTLAGIDAATANKIHNDFEKNSPEQHQLFLEALGFKEDEITKLRKLSGADF